MILTTVFWLSFSALAFEILLARCFSISQWNHLSFMVISLALFGFAASGTFFSLIDAQKPNWEKRLSSNSVLTIFTILFAFTTLISFQTLNRLPLDYFRLPLEPVQILYLLAAYLILSLPFFVTGSAISLAYAAMPQKAGLVHFATMAGSACGAVLPVPLLPIFGEGKLIVLCALFPVAGILLAGLFRAVRPPPMIRLLSKKTRFSRLALLTLGISVLIWAFGFIFCDEQSTFRIKPSPYKSLSQILQFPKTKIKDSHSGIRGRIDTIQSPFVRFAPGLSLKFTNSLPEQWATYRDGDRPFFLYHLESKQSTAFAKFTLPYAGYLLKSNPEKVLIIQTGGGSGIPCAKAAGAKNISIIEQNPQIAQIVRRQYHLLVINENPRAYLARTEQRFDMIHIENWGTSIPGAAVLSQEYFFTKEACTAYLRHLTPSGVLLISRKLLLPPSDSLRLWATVYECLRSLNIDNPEAHIIMLRNWDTFSLIASNRPLKDQTLIKQFARNMNFDLVYFKGIQPGLVNRYNVYEHPFHFSTIGRLARSYRTGTENRFFREYLLDVRPQSDDRPFPARFLKWFNLNAVYKSKGSRFYALMMSGEITVVIVFLEALVISLILLIVPVFLISKRKKPSFSNFIFFLGVGSGFMFVELFFIKQFTLLFGDPIVSFTFVLAGVLVFSSAGGLWSQRFDSRAIWISLTLLVLLILFMIFSTDFFSHQILKRSLFIRYLLALLLLMPTGFLLGLPFPLGMRYLLQYPVQRAYAWSANGCASVLTSIVSAQIALSWGISKILVCAGVSYLVVWVSVINKKD